MRKSSGRCKSCGRQLQAPFEPLKPRGWCDDCEVFDKLSIEEATHLLIIEMGGVKR